MGKGKVDYPKHWTKMREAVLARADYRCEGSPLYPTCRAENGRPHPVTGSVVVLTTAHRHGTSTMSEDLADLLALCQRCHLAYDREMHLRHAAQTRLRRRGLAPVARGQTAADPLDAQEFRRDHPLMEVVASAGVRLWPHQGGRYMVGCCPLHGGRWPALWIQPETGHFGCVGCGAAGDVIAFLERYAERHPERGAVAPSGAHAVAIQPKTSGKTTN